MQPTSPTLAWPTLRIALQTYFGSGPAFLDSSKIHAGWCGLSLVVTAFKRLEAVEGEAEKVELLDWLTALRTGAIRQSVAFEDLNSTSWHDTLSNLVEPLSPAELGTIPRSRTSSLTYTKPLVFTSTSFERGSDATRSPPPSTIATSPEPCRSSHDSVGDVNRSPILTIHHSPTKKRRSNSVGHLAIVGLAGRTRDSTVSTSALSSFADFSDHHDLDLEDTSDSSDDEDKVVFRAPAPRRPVPSSYLPPYSPSSKNNATISNGNGNHYNNNKAVSTNGHAPLSPDLSAENLDKVQVLAQRLSEVTGIPFAKCMETISRFPDEDLAAINPNGPIPSHFLPPAPVYVAPTTSTTNGHSKPTRPRSAAMKSSTSNASSSTGRTHEGSASANGSKASSDDGSGVIRTRVQRPHDPNRPNFSYSALIGQAILSTGNKRMRLAEIYDYVTANYSYYKKNECGWQNSIRHNLSLQPVFKKIPDVAMPGKKGCFWTIVDGEEWRFANGGWLKMERLGNNKKDKRSSQKATGSANGSGSGSSANGHSRKRKRQIEEEEEEEQDMEDRRMDQARTGGGGDYDSDDE